VQRKISRAPLDYLGSCVRRCLTRGQPSSSNYRQPLWCFFDKVYSMAAMQRLASLVLIRRIAFSLSCPQRLRESAEVYQKCLTLRAEA
jgi:hypothetical protein